MHKDGWCKSYLATLAKPKSLRQRSASGSVVRNSRFSGFRSLHRELGAEERERERERESERERARDRCAMFSAWTHRKAVVIWQ
jgi:hypothetical protein